MGLFDRPAPPTSGNQEKLTDLVPSSSPKQLGSFATSDLRRPILKTEKHDICPAPNREAPYSTQEKMGPFDRAPRTLAESEKNDGSLPDNPSSSPTRLRPRTRLCHPDRLPAKQLAPANKWVRFIASLPPPLPNSRKNKDSVPSPNPLT